MTAPDFASGDADVYFTTRTTHYHQASYGITATVMRAAHCLSDRKASVIFIQSLLIATNWRYHITRDGLPTLRIATKKPLRLDGLILLNIHIGDLNTCVWFAIAPQLAVDILLGIAFINHFKRGIFPSEQKIVSWHSGSVAITTKLRAHTAPKANLSTDKPMPAAYHSYTEADFVNEVVWGSKQIELPLCTQNHALAKTQRHGLTTVEPNDVSGHSTLAVRGIRKLTLGQPFYTHVSNISSRRVRLPKRMRIAHTAEPQTVIHALGCKVPQQGPSK